MRAPASGVVGSGDEEGRLNWAAAFLTHSRYQPVSSLPFLQH